MKPSEIPVGFGTVLSLELRPLRDEAFSGSFTVEDSVELLDGAVDGPSIRIEGGMIPVRGFDERSQLALEDLLARDLARRCWIAQMDRDSGGCRAIRVQVHEFLQHRSLSEPLRILLDEDCLEQIRGLLKATDFAGAVTKMSERFVLEGSSASSPASVVVSAGRGNVSERESAFRIHGVGFDLDVRWRKCNDGPPPNEALFVNRIVPRRPARRGGGPDGTPSCTLLSGRVEWLDASRDSLSATVRTRLDELVGSSEGYLNLWEQYNRIERESIESRALEFGAIPYRSRREVMDDRRLTCFEFDCGRLDPRQLAAFEDCRGQRESLEAVLHDDSSGERRSGPAFVGEILEFLASGRVVLAPLDRDFVEAPPTGFLRMSVTGHKQRLDRRERARDLIGSARCGIKWLGLLLEGKPFPVQARSNERALTAAAKRAFRGPPTPAQELALKVALNTPDIAIIQGPPGTGKTRVISALQTRLAEIGEGEDGPFKQTLLTSFQHDAVDNVASACTAFGLPAFRVGVREGDLQAQRACEHWRSTQIGKLKASTATVTTTPLRVARRNLQLRIRAAERAPTTLAGELALLKEVRQQVVPWVEIELIAEIDGLIRRLGAPARAAEASSEREIAIRAIRNLPTTAESARDDGPKRATKALVALESADCDVLGEEERLLLRSLVDWNGEGEMPGDGSWAPLKLSLLDRLSIPLQRNATPLRNLDFETILLKVRHSLERASLRVPADASIALEELIEELESDPARMNEEISRYVASVAATVQRSVGSEMLELKSFGDGIDHGRWPRFRSVIVDEAARCNPLDLMIPLCLAQRRIVLVGDHRQLPHVLEPGVERELNRSADELTREALGKSLFERLAKHVRELEARDGIIRYVRLDRQYRMAPSLGKFVSDSFYAPYGEQFESGRTESELSHRLGGPYEGKRGVWIDCPIAEGAETRGRSKARPAEADRIARTIVDRFADRPDLSVGIITFYAAQVKEIERALALRGIGEERHGKWEIPSGWRSTVASEGREVRDRIRVGTVDAFQGMEFDVVFLSTVRSNDLPLGDNPSWFRKFGHLLLENRVCVAMSRQERLLFVVGDSRMFEPSDRQDQPGVRQLRDFFLNFCGGPHGLRL